ncbi:unnamed protein product [Urochloa humidicola]
MPEDSLLLVEDEHTYDLLYLYISPDGAVIDGDISNISIPQLLDSPPNILKCGDISTRVIQSFPDDHMTGSGDSKWIYFYGFVAATFSHRSYIHLICMAICFEERVEASPNSGRLQSSIYSFPEVQLQRTGNGYCKFQR